MKLIVTILAVLLSGAAIPPAVAESSGPGRTVRVRPGDGSFARALKAWKPHDTILLAPGEYPERLKLVSEEKNIVRDLTVKAAVPGSVVFRGDVPAPKFTPCGGGIWQAPFPRLPEGVFERDTLTRYTCCGTRAGLEWACGAWAYDEKNKILYVRTTASDDPAKHCLTVGVTPEHGFNIYCGDVKSGPRNVRFEGFAVTGFYSRCQSIDQAHIPSSQKRVPWGIVVSKPWENVVIRDVTAFLNGLGVGFCGGSRNSTIENCRVWGNGNPFNHSGGGAGIYDSNAGCTVRNNIGADNSWNDVYLYSGTFGSDTKFEYNRAYGTIRCKGEKEKMFRIRNCIASNFTHLENVSHVGNCFAFNHVPGGETMTQMNLFPRCEKEIVPDDIFADPENFDCRPMSGVPADIVRRAPQAPSEKLFFVSSKGDDSADGRSVKTAFATLKRAEKALVPGAELYIVGPVEGDLVLKGLKNVAIRGRGRFAAVIKGGIILENCENVKLERLSPRSITVKKGNGVSVTQCYGKFSAAETENLRITHNFFKSARFADCKRSFITANVFTACAAQNVTGWSDYNAYADTVPAREKHSFKAGAVPGKRGTFRNAELFDGRAVDGMPVGPYRRQSRNVRLHLEGPRISVTPETAVVEITGNIPFTGKLRWGDTPECAGVAAFSAASCRHRISLTGLRPGKKYFVRCEAKAEIPECFSNAELTGTALSRGTGGKAGVFTTSLKFAEPRTLYVSPSGSDAGPGTWEAPFRTVSGAVDRLSPGDTLIVRGGEYCETVELCVSGTPERPVTIRGAENETVRFHGGKGNLLADGLRIVNQSNLVIENMQFIGRSLAAGDGYSHAPIRVENGSGITFRRLLVGGATYTFLLRKSKGIVIEDSVLGYGHAGLGAFDTSLAVRHCAFAFGGVNFIDCRNSGSEPFTLEDNIFLELHNMKGGNVFVDVFDPAVFTERNNCFLTRMPWEERRIYGWRKVSHPPFQGRWTGPYSAFLREFKREGTSFAADPRTKILPRLTVTYAGMEDWRKNWRKNQTSSSRERGQASLPDRLDFRSYLPGNPEVIKRGCGPRYPAVNTNHIRK